MAYTQDEVPALDKTFVPSLIIGNVVILTIVDVVLEHLYLGMIDAEIERSENVTVFDS